MADEKYMCGLTLFDVEYISEKAKTFCHYSFEYDCYANYIFTHCGLIITRRSNFDEINRRNEFNIETFVYIFGLRVTKFFAVTGCNYDYEFYKESIEKRIFPAIQRNECFPRRADISFLSGGQFNKKDENYINVIACAPSLKKTETKIFNGTSCDEILTTLHIRKLVISCFIDFDYLKSIFLDNPNAQKKEGYYFLHLGKFGGSYAERLRKFVENENKRYEEIVKKTKESLEISLGQQRAKISIFSRKRNLFVALHYK